MNYPDKNTDITSYCRLCLTNDAIIRNIFVNDLQRNWVDSDISAQIYQATNIKVSIGDGPTGICGRCFRTVLAIICFRRKCFKANDYLRTRCENMLLDESNQIRKEQIFTGFIDLGSEKDLLPISINPASSIANLDDELSDYDVPSPIFEYNDNDEKYSTCKLTTNCNRSETQSREPLLKCRYKLKGGRPPKKLSDELPKLKKRDLMETKAYQGLCHLCGREFQHLWVHLRSHSKEPTDTCDICGKGFRSKPNLALHILLHKEAEIPCEVCGKRYRTRMRLKRHMRVHTGEKPFSCNICEKKFYTKYNVDVHMRIHTGEKPYSCNKCGERFTHSYSIKQHMEKMHK